MLKDKVAIVTGSSRGIGRAIAIAFARQGAKVVINYSSPSSKEKAESVVEEILAIGGKAICIEANIASMEEAKKLVDGAVEGFGKLDIFVNNAGITRDMLLLRMSEEQFDQVIDVNLKGVFNCTKHASKAMMRKGGSIINVTSVVGLVGNIGQSNYAASKAGVIGFTKSVAREFARKNIRVNAVAPGFITSDMTDELSKQVKEEILRNIPLKRMGDVEEVANVALFLASELSSYITGEIIRVDGGMAM